VRNSYISRKCGFCEDGEQTGLYRRGDTQIGGDLPVNTDGGCIANGEPIGASGLRQIYETVLQLRGDAGDRQVPNKPITVLPTSTGAPGVSACVVSLVNDENNPIGVRKSA